MIQQTRFEQRRPTNWWLSLGLFLIAFSMVLPHIPYFARTFSPDWLDGLWGFVCGIGIGIELSLLIRLARFRRATAALGLLVCFGALASPAHASPAPAAVETRSGFFTTTDGVRLHYLEAGQGSAIVFVPGWTMPAWIWEKQIAFFAQHYHVVALDPRDQGESDKVAFGNSTPRRARDIQELVTHLKLSPAVLVGWSLAVSELLTYAEQFGGHDVLAYVLVDGGVWQKQDARVLSGMLGAYQLVENNRAIFTDQFVRSIYRKPQPDDYIKRVEEASLQMPADSAVAASISALGRDDWTPAIRKLDRPVLVMCETKFKPTAADPISSLLPTTQVELFPDAGHALFVDDADHFNSVLQAFLEKLPPADSTGN
jgi:non-heme chloroperoxidase